MNINHFIMIGSLICFGFCSGLYTPIAWSEMIVLPAEQKRNSIENKKISESSGLACSTRDKHLLWTHNDSGHMPIIYAMDSTGRDLGAFHLEDIESRDWEDMDAFKYQGKHYLLIADTGDNFRMLWDYRISIIKEPKIGKKNRSAISPAWSFTFKYEDGSSYDVEAVAVDVSREKIVLLTKRTPHALMFELPLKPLDEEQVQVAVKTGEFNDIVKSSALDISADGKLMSINTYRRIHLYTRSDISLQEKSLQENAWKYKHSLSYKKMFQPEAMCLAKDQKHYYVSSEKKPYLLKIRAKQSD